MTRQAVSAIESDLYLPSTAVALRLAGVLSCRVEDLFTPAASEKPQMGVGGGLAYNPGINTSTDNAFVGIDLANPNLRRQLATFGNGRRLGWGVINYTTYGFDSLFKYRGFGTYR